MATTKHRVAELAQGLVASDLMTEHVATIDTRAPVRDALRLMQCWGVRHLPVTIGDCFVGLVDDRILARAMAGDDIADEPVDLVMARYVPQVGPDASAQRVARLLSSSRTDAVVVIDPAGRLLGIITLADVVGAVAD